ncbi:hypothetical protein AX17_002112 [Amanita inopinata Kibby_2008]|nr:hypothetical protein AX17_002112 [Amanita inopinata Kibby_2008]
MMPRLVLPIGLGLLSWLALFIFYSAFSDISKNLSPQGCRMSWMSPSYVLQSQFNRSWTPLGNRYSLWLYREVGWDANQITGDRVPILFIPGNAGSSHQVRSIASSATRQYYASPHTVSPDFVSRAVKPLDFFAVEFNEDLSAFHGSTLKSQIAYTSRAMEYILSLYPTNTSIIILGHSMGGIVATSLLPTDHISAIVTMSTPHTLPPARFDPRVDDIYRTNLQILTSNPTPIVSLCGGAADTMIPSESCILPPVMGDTYRKTVFTSALEGAWTGVGHREMVWCHQVRWRVARAALELGESKSPEGRGLTLDKWLRDGHTLPHGVGENSTELRLAEKSMYEIMPKGQRLVLKKPGGTTMHLLPIPDSNASTVKLVIFVSQGSVDRVSPQNPFPLKVTVFTCSSSGGSTPDCLSLRPITLRLVPNPIPGHTFPVPDEGSDESEGVVVYEAEIARPGHYDQWVGIQSANGDGRGWVVGGFDCEEIVDSRFTALSLLLGGRAAIALNTNALSTHVSLPKVKQSALLVYRLNPRVSDSTCNDILLSPLILHTSDAIEAHYFPLHNSAGHRILLHSHSPAPFVDTLSLSQTVGLNFTVYSSAQPGCGQKELFIEIDWSATLGRWVSRYPTTVVIWATSITALLLFRAWGIEEKTGGKTASSRITVYLP